MGDCGFDFRIGKTYLVYADKEEDGELATSICHRTRPIDHADTDLRFLRGEQPNTSDLTLQPSPAAQGADGGGMLCGTVRRNNDPVVGSQVMIWRVREFEREMESEESSGEDGSYCARNLGPGRYVISAVERMSESEQSEEEIPAFFRYAPPAGAFGGLQKPMEIELTGGQEVRSLDIFLEELSGFRVVGRIGVEGGMPQAELVVSLGTGSDELFSHVQTLRLRPGSEFTFEGVPSGTYRLEVLFFDKAWKDWVTPTQGIRITGNLEGLVVLPERKRK